jgi:RNA polymerase sigma factor (TIGR02999 family)
VSEVTRILNRVEQGEAQGAEDLLPLVYDELRGLAAAKMAHQPPGQTLQATALVHEAFLRLTAGTRHSWRDRSHFFRAAAEAMRRILIDNARKKSRWKRGGKLERVNLERLELAAETPPNTLLVVHEALERLAVEDEPKAELVKQIGEGGCGVVFMAEQEQPVRRRVALKVIKLGMDTKAGGGAVRRRTPGAGDDGSSEHRQGVRWRVRPSRAGRTS